ncbi:MAG: QueT transporter family protein [Clostridia bacterium]|nr:QueT transporter family protein [Clostridia bacterium]
MNNLFRSIAGDFSRWNAKMLCRAGVIAALYTVLTWSLGSLAYGPLQVRPAEALCVLPLFFPEAVPALYVGCILANLFSGYGVYDIFLGSLATLLAAALTYLTGKIVKNNVLRVVIGGIFPILLNAFIVPAVWILAGTPDVVYWYEFGVMILNEALWIYVLGIPLYFAVLRLRNRGVSVFTSPVHVAAGNKNSAENPITPDISPDEQEK